LNADSKLRQQYSDLKQQLAKKYKYNRGGYTKSKQAFINKVLSLVEKEKTTEKP